MDSDAHAARHPWTVDFQRQPGAPWRLVGLHHAGGGASLFKNWSAGLGGWAEVSAIQLPGRENRWSEPLCDDRATMVDAIVDTLGTTHDGRPLLLFGHSLGAALGFCVAHEMRARGMALPQALVVSGRSPVTGLPEFDFDVDLHADDELLKQVRAWGGIPDAMQQQVELITRMLPRLRSDLRLSQALHRHQPTLTALPMPIVAFGGTDDPLVPIDHLDRWADFTLGGFERHVFAGAHFFLRDERTLFDVLLPALFRQCASLLPPRSHFI